MEMSWRCHGDPQIYYWISEEISEDIPEDLLEYPKKFSKDLHINGYPRRSSEILGYPRMSFGANSQMMGKAHLGTRFICRHSAEICCSQGLN